MSFDYDDTSIEDLSEFEDEEDGIIEYLDEMATIGTNQEDNFSVRVNPDRGRGDAYFKVYDHTSYNQSKRVIRLAFKELKAFDHRNPDGKEFWEIWENKYKNQLKGLIKFMKEKPKSEDGRKIAKTNWELTIKMWNNECGFEWDENYSEEKYPETGCKPNSSLSKNPQYVPLNTPMPDYTKLDKTMVRRVSK